MLKKTITFTDYNGVARTEDFFFNLNKAEITEMEMSISGGFVEMINRIVAAQDNVAIVEVFKDIITRSYGEKTPDGRGFVKKRDGKFLYEDFIATEAYSELFTELASDADSAAKFINGIVPAVDMDKPTIVPAAN